MDHRLHPESPCRAVGVALAKLSARESKDKKISSRLKRKAVSLVLDELDLNISDLSEAERRFWVRWICTGCGLV